MSPSGFKGIGSSEPNNNLCLLYFGRFGHVIQQKMMVEYNITQTEHWIQIYT